MLEITEDDVREALHDVIDPELGINVVDLGLVYQISVEDGRRIHVLMTMTTPGCPATNYIQGGAERRLMLIPGAEDVEVRLAWAPPWSPDMMSAEARHQLGMD